MNAPEKVHFRRSQTATFCGNDTAWIALLRLTDDLAAVTCLNCLRAMGERCTGCGYRKLKCDCAMVAVAGRRKAGTS